MDVKILVVIIGGFVSLFVAMSTQYVITWRERNAVKREEKNSIRTPESIEAFLSQCHFRLAEIRRRVKESDSNKCDIFLFEKNPDGIKIRKIYGLAEKGVIWFPRVIWLLVFFHV